MKKPMIVLGEAPAQVVERWLETVDAGASEIVVRHLRDLTPRELNGSALAYLAGWLSWQGEEAAPFRPSARLQAAAGVLLSGRWLRKAVDRGDLGTAVTLALDLGMQAERLHLAPLVELGKAHYRRSSRGGRNRGKGALASAFQNALEALYGRDREGFKLTWARKKVGRDFGVSDRTVAKYTTDPRAAIAGR